VPLYEYECTKCQYRFERLQKFSDPPASECPICTAPVSQLLSAPAIQFKGSGWYVTDYAGKSPAASKGSNGNGSSSETKSESKPESKPEAKPAPAAKTD
jgi:putative FmdB family regulatory protein